jgi:carbon storage regulator CsrA
MLVLTRKLGEKVIIGDNITIAVVAVENGRVRLAFDAPKEILILRAELAGRRDGDGGLEPKLAASGRCQCTISGDCSGS